MIIFRFALLSVLVIALVATLGRASTFFSVTKIKDIKEISSVEYSSILTNPFSSLKERSDIAVKLAEFAEKIASTEEKIPILCETLNALTATLKKEPLRARSLVTWANVKQLLGNHHCQGDESKGFKEALEFALAANPQDQQVLFNSALIYLWAGQNEQAYSALKRVLELGTDTSSLQREFIYSLVTDASKMEKMIPAKLPQQIEFTKYLFSQSDQIQIETIGKKKLWDFQAVGVLEFYSRFEQGLIDKELYIEKLASLWKISRESAVTPLLDRLLGNYFAQLNNQPLSKFFTSRSQLSEIEIVVAQRKSDSRPEKSSLAGWGSNAKCNFDNFFASVGFYLPRRKTLRRIELHSQGMADQQIAAFVRILASDDNSVWEDLTGVSTISQVNVFGKSVLQIDLPGDTKRFWKIHYANPARNTKFSAPLTQFIRAFGVGALND